MKIAKRYEMVALDKIIPYIRNSKKHPQEQINQIRASFREFGVLSPCLVDEEYNLLAGHGRLLAAQQEKLEEINCVVVEGLTEAQKKAFIITDNKIGENAPWDDELLSLELTDLQAMEFDLDLLGFEPADLDKYLNGDEETEDDDFDLETALNEEAFVQKGDLWHLGNHRLLCGDSTNAEDVDRLMNGKKANLLLTDPPYGISYESKAGTIKNDSLADDKLYDFLFSVFTNALGAMASDASAYVFHADTKGEIFRRAFREAGFHLSGCIVWKKSSFTLGRSPYQWGHEPALYGWAKKGKHQWYAGRKESTVWEFDKPKNNDIHPTIKPIPLLAYAIKNSTLTGCIVLDLFSGSFSTGMACQQTDRVCYALELDEKYASASIKRYAESFGTKDIIVERNGKTLLYDEVVFDGQEG